MKKNKISILNRKDKYLEKMKEIYDIKDLLFIENKLVAFFMAIVCFVIAFASFILSIYSTNLNASLVIHQITMIIFGMFFVMINKTKWNLKLKIHLVNFLSGILFLSITINYYEVLGISIWTLLFLLLLISIIRIDGSMVFYIVISGMLADVYLYIFFSERSLQIVPRYYVVHFWVHLLMGIFILRINYIFRNNFINNMEQYRKEKEQNEEIKKYIKKIEANELRLHELAYYDVLTQLPNRKMFLEEIETTYDLCKKDHLKYSVVFIDLDDFKKVNDTMGHYIGDLFLFEVSNRLSEKVLAGDLLARIGGDEFALIIKQGIEKERLLKYVGDFKECFNLPFDMKGYSIEGSASFGIAIYPEDAINTVDLISAADMAMYKAKKELGKNAICFYK